MNEVTEILKKYLSEELNSVFYHGDEGFVKRFRTVLLNGKRVEDDAPDTYIVYEDELWIIEHFEFDCCESGK